jgi:uncharacterized membrane protein YeaQ/YmgE (transglycosylase-associated protein family)
MDKFISMKDNIFQFLEELGIGYKYLINGFFGALIWSLYKKLSFLEAVRQIIIGSVVAGYITPLIAHHQSLPIEHMAALSFVVGMMGMIIIEATYQYVKSFIVRYKKGKTEVLKEEIKAEEQK